MIRKNLIKIKKLVSNGSSKVSSSTFPVKRKPPTVVHIGNVGLSYANEIPCAKTEKFSSRFPGINFIGIDLRGASSKNRNWKQVKADALSGLNKLEDNSVSIIRSEMALGYYTSRVLNSHKVDNLADSVAYARKVLDVSIKKLKPGGKVVIVADPNVAREIVVLRDLCGFRSVKKELVLNESKMSFWTDKYGGNGKKVQVTLIK